MTQGRLPGPHAPGWRMLARGRVDADGISRCSGAHIHLDYDKLTVRFDPDEFLAFAQMVAEAAANLGGSTEFTPPGPPTAFSKN
jgi:hypothetical protein